MNAKVHWRNGEKGNHFREISWFYGQLAIVIAVGLCLASGSALAAGACSTTAQKAFTACRHDALADFLIAQGNCSNLSDPNGRVECNQDEKVALQEERSTCFEQRKARREICGVLGEAPYDPEIDPAIFVDPAQIGTTIAPNPYFPLLRGRTWIYEGGTETNTVTVTSDTRVILGVTCAVVHDVVKDSGEVIEDTKDWYAQDINGNVWYFGEISQEFQDDELVSLEGSWTAGIDSAKPGVIMAITPAVGDLYRQEFSLGNAEDMAEVISLTGTATVPAASCNGDCLITRDFSPLEPDVQEHKYFKTGVGQILVIDVETGAREELVEMTDLP